MSTFNVFSYFVHENISYGVYWKRLLWGNKKNIICIPLPSPSPHTHHHLLSRQWNVIYIFSRGLAQVDTYHRLNQPRHDKTHNSQENVNKNGGIVNYWGWVTTFFINVFTVKFKLTNFHFYYVLFLVS